MKHDVVIVGAGLVGLSVGRALSASHPGISILVLDKETRLAAHQSSHNSGVVHSGLYYKPGSLKARLCVEGGRMLEELCHAESVPFRRSGKLVIATSPEEVERLDELERRGRANGLPGLERVDGEGIRDHEPAATGIDALHVPSAGVADFPAVAAAIGRRLESDGASISLGAPVESIAASEDEVAVRAGGDEHRARVLVNCAGLQSDRVAAMAGVSSPIRIVPFRGEYYTLDPALAGLVRSLIYPVPDPRFPFLGVHFSRRVDDTVEVGPNAVLALGREHYRGAAIRWPDLRETLSTGAFWKLAGRHWLTGLQEAVGSRSRAMYARSARRLVPAVRPQHLLPGGAGVRAQALSPEGKLVDDFVIEHVGSSIHVLNAPSPGATASLAIGAHIAGLAARHLPG